MWHACTQHHHPDEPDDYIAYQRWTERMSITHTQHRCPVCGLHKVWAPNTSPDSGYTADDTHTR